MFNRIVRAFRNDVVMYPEIKGNPEIQTESIQAILVIALLSAVISFLANTFFSSSDMGPVAAAITNFLGLVIGYLVVSGWAWLVGSVIGPGEGTFTDVRTALSYGYAPYTLSGIPVVGIIFSLWALVTMSSSIRETLEIGKGLTFFIVITSIVFQLFVIFAAVTTIYVTIFGF